MAIAGVPRSSPWACLRLGPPLAFCSSALMTGLSLGSSRSGPIRCFKSCPRASAYTRLGPEWREGLEKRYGAQSAGQFRTIGIHTCDAARQKTYEVAKTPEFAVALRQRRKVEALFSELKNQIGLRRLRLRRIKFVREQFYLAAVAQNLKRLARFLNMTAQPTMASA